MTFRPSIWLGLGIGVVLALLLTSASLLGIFQLSIAEMSPLLLLWVLLPILAVPLLILTLYRVFGLLTARYQLDRDGFYLQWGLAREQIPLASITEIIPAESVDFDLATGFRFGWPGCITGETEIQSLGTVELFTSRSRSGALVLRTSDERSWIISPADRTGFIQQFTDSTRLGALENIPPLSERPDFYTSRIWEDRIARVLILAGLVISLALLGYLGALAGSLSGQVPFGFDPLGAPSPIAPAGRLLLLPLIGGFCWLADLVLGAWLYRDENNRLIAYGIWGSAIVLGFVLWGALIALLNAVDHV